MLALVVLGAFFAYSGIAAAQEERPQIMPGERRPAKKKDSGPRAVGIVQLAANGKATLIPIAILVNGKFWDASAYKADPIPMSLDSGVVYEGERSGNSLGLFTVGGALHSNNATAQTPWLATGIWRPEGMEPPAKEAKANTAPVGMDDANAPPRLTRDPSRLKQTAEKSDSKPSSENAPPKSTSSHDDDRPRLTKGTPSSPESAQPTAPAPASKPADSKDDKKDAKAEAHSNVPSSDSGAGQGARPVLRRGKPAESFADEEVPGYSKPGAATKTTPSDAGKVVEATAAVKSDVQLIPAISDASGPPPHSFTFEWLKGEEDDRRKQMMTMAKDQLHAYLAAQAKNQIAAKPASPAAKRRASKPEEPIFEDVQMIAYDLWNSNQPVILFSAQAHMPLPSIDGPASESQPALQYSILLVAFPDTYQNLHKIYSGVTDKFHLDLTPRLELIDAIDADGDGRGELLFRQTSDAGTGWVVYRATADKLWKMFDSLNPE